MSESFSKNKKINHKFLIPDTNIYLHFKPFNEIEWDKLSASKKATLIVPHVVIGELNKQKDQNPREHLRERAAKIIKLLTKFSDCEDAEIKVRRNVFIQFLPWSRKFNFREYGLSDDCADDRLLAVALQIKEETPDVEIAIVTDDINLRLKAKSLNVAVLSLPAECEIPAKPDAEQKRIQELEKKIRELQSSTPHLSVKFQNGQSVCRCEIAEPYSIPAPSFFEDLQKLMLEYPQWENPENNPQKLISDGGELSETLTKNDLQELSSQLRQIHPLTIESYNRQLQYYYQQYADYHSNYFRYQNQLDLIVECKVILVNEGTVPAQDIDLFFQVEKGMKFLLENYLPQEPIAPAPPAPPQEMAAVIGAGISSFFQRIFSKPDNSKLLAPAIAVSNRKAGLSRITISPNQQSLSCKLKYLKHYTGLPIRFFIQFDSYEAAKSCRLKYAALVANIQQKVEGELHFVVEK